MLPRRNERREMRRTVTLALDLALVLGFAAAQAWGLTVWSQTLAPSERFWGPFTSVPALLLTVIVLPFLMQHTAHHVNARIPLYRLSKSQRCLERAYPEEVIFEPWRWTALGKTLARCKLYDYENHRWLNFTGRPTTEPNPVMRELQERGKRRDERRAKAATRHAAALTNAGSPAGQT